jgi:hypothetical protein
MSIYVSIDVASKSLAIGVYKINLQNINIDEKIIPLDLKVYDLTKGSSNFVCISEKAKELKNILVSLDTYLNADTKVLIEYQMNANHKSNAIFNMLIYHYCNYEIIIMKPALKNQIYLRHDLTLSRFLAHASNNYQANKNHSKFNFLYFIYLFKYQEKIKNIKNKNIDDIADTFMQLCAYLKKI